jgi:hypothetical protein
MRERNGAPTLERSHHPLPEVVMTQLATPETHTDTVGPTSTHWRVAGGFVVAHVVLLFAALSLEKSSVHGDSPAKVQQVLGDANLDRVLAGGYAESVAFLVLAPALVLVAALVGRRTEVGRLAARTFLALGVAYIASTLAVGFPPGAAALYGAHHGVDGQTLATVMDIRTYGFYLQVAISCAMMVALGIAALADGVFVKWVGWCGAVLGAIGIVAMPFAPNAIAMVWIVWFLGLGVLALRGPRKA